ncbi:MAG: hypothetical protein NTZ16_08240 [Verrucomicrobia bacterium]|nr:hypothetical protein [Verrucomicrobiota bacterium]
MLLCCATLCVRNAAAGGIDYAESHYVDSWLRHPVYGDPSFDSFKRAPGNPIHTGAPPFEWPVNGFFFPDPANGNWYLYIGAYAKGYAGPPPSRCLLYRSTDRGQTWENLGTVLQGAAEMFDKNGHTPDVSVVFADGRYHMIYDWSELDFSREGGLAYAWAEKPEGPWHRTAQPITRNTTLPPLLGKYRRTYAATLVRRKHDWMILAMMDTTPPFSWAMFAMTADKPEGPYSERTLVCNVDSDYFHPPLMEYYPAFVREGWVYAPATSLAANRNFQTIFRAPLEKATKADAWEIYRYGSVWHPENVPQEADGIWGQTFSGWLDTNDILQVMFPSRDTKGFGTINLASRPWAQPFCEHGFRFSGHQGASLTCLRKSFLEFTLNTELRVNGTARIFWNYQAPLGPNRPVAGAVLHPLSVTRHQAVEFSPAGWRIIEVDALGKTTTLASGIEQAGKVTVDRRANGATTLTLDGKLVWKGMMNVGRGAIGLLAEAKSCIAVEHFKVTGNSAPGVFSYLHTEAWLGAGENPAKWVEKKDPRFRFGIGAVRRDGDGRAKWNFPGRGFTLWSPKGPDYGMVEIRVDGAVVATVDLHANQAQSSQPVFSKTGLTSSFHAVVLQPKSGRLVVDSLDVSD